MSKLYYVIVAMTGICVPAVAQAAYFSFDNAPQYGTVGGSSLTVDGVQANFSTTGNGFSYQAANVLGFTPSGFSGICIYPNSVFAADLQIDFPTATVTGFSILYSPEEYACDSSALMRATAYLNGVYVGTSTMTANPPGTWPTATLAINAAGGFDRVVVHYASAPPTGGDWGPIFMADNMNVTTASAVVGVPEPASLSIMGLGGVLLLRRRRR